METARRIGPVVAEEVNEGDRHPVPREALLLIEVGVTSQRRDRRKAELYASVGAAAYWIVDVPRDVVIVHTGPRPDGTWGEVREIGLDDTLTLPGTDLTFTGARLLRRAPAKRSE